jgi:hypothetical protein
LGFFQTAVKANREKVFPERLPAMQTKENVYMADSGLSIEIERSYLQAVRHNGL